MGKRLKHQIGPKSAWPKVGISRLWGWKGEGGGEGGSANPLIPSWAMSKSLSSTSVAYTANLLLPLAHHLTSNSFFTMKCHKTARKVKRKNQPGSGPHEQPHPQTEVCSQRQLSTCARGGTLQKPLQRYKREGSATANFTRSRKSSGVPSDLKRAKPLKNWAVS